MANKPVRGAHPRMTVEEVMERADEAAKQAAIEKGDHLLDALHKARESDDYENMPLGISPDDDMRDVVYEGEGPVLHIGTSIADDELRVIALQSAVQSCRTSNMIHAAPLVLDRAEAYYAWLKTGERG